MIAYQSLIICNNVFLIVESNWEFVDNMTWVGGVILMDNGWIDYEPDQGKKDFNFKSLYQALGEDHYESPFNSSNTDSIYYEPDEFQQKFSNIQSVSSYFHLNCHSLNSNWEGFRNLLCDLHGETLWKLVKYIEIQMMVLYTSTWILWFLAQTRDDKRGVQ